ncbi:phenylacetate--CoA ligase family protein [Arhodomonas sp. AD133]|uniref:phenylacetate--CoA ligase family protein n=1 Tax=Arhodomonas sp. AD133 TaxID=3415009 RepID=UPI003EC03391
MEHHYDDLETRTPAERTQALREALPRQIAHAKAKSPYFAERLAAVAPQEIVDAGALAGLPVLRKSELIERQQAEPPFGGLAAVDFGAMQRVFQSPGPIYEPQTRRPDFWRFARAMVAAGFRRGGGLVHNTFAYHFTPAGAMFDNAAEALECPVFPAGTGQTELQVKAIAQLRPRYFTGTPSFLNILLEKAHELGEDIGSLTHGLVTAEPLPPSLVERFRERGIEVHQCYGTADLGLIAYETSAREGLVVDEGVLVEIVRPGTGEPVAGGEVGEVVVTTLNPDYPLIRFATGDLSAVLSGECPTGRTNQRIRGWMGRADQTAKVRGLFVHPSQVHAVTRDCEAVRRARLVITQSDHRDVMTLQCEVDGDPEGLEAALAERLREVCHLRGEVALVPTGTLANDGKVIDDQRTYE